MQATIRNSGIKGTIQAPTSKSSMQRACAAALLRKGTTLIHHPGYSNDDKAALRVIAGLGATVETLADGSLKVTGNGVHPIGKELNCGESGLGIRMFAPLMALSDKPVRVIGEGSLLSRPMDFFDEIFPLLGIKCISNKGKLPLQIQGPLQPRNITIDGSLSSQFLTGLLMAYAAAGAKDVSIKVNNLKSKPYIDLTLQVMSHFGWAVENRRYQEFYFPGSTGASAQDQIHSASKAALPLNYMVEGDWSGGAFLLVAGAIAGPVTVKGLDRLSTQADKAILQALEDCGAALTFSENRVSDNQIVIGPSSSAPVLKAFRFDATDCPDLFPPLVALAAYCEGDTVIKGVDRLAHKESNRALTLQAEFGKMGVAIGLEGDLMTVKGKGGKTGKEGVRGAQTHSHHDHRIAMAAAVAGLRADGDMLIEEAQAIDKSYPDFYLDLERMGATVIKKEEILN